jgi:GrpB-like predicted nucleotidyltransferase (UPF0157 family)
MITIVPYRPEWPEEFRAIAQRLRAAPGVLAIHHIGSTAVPGLAAKDVIDLQVTVTGLEGFALPAGPNGFVLGAPVTDHCPPGRTLEPRELEKRFYKSAARPANVHIRVAGRFNQRYPLLCRDYLRSHAAAANAYGEIKRQLARYFPNDVEAYYDIKDPVFDVIMAGAEDWAAATHWAAPESD